MGNNDWELYTLSDLTNNFDSMRIPVKEADRRSGLYPYYGASGVIDLVSDYLFDGDYLLIAEDGENLRSRKTPIAFMASGKFWVNNHAHIVRGNIKANTKFLMYYLSQADISGFLTGSTIPKLTQDNLNRIPIYIPSLNQQCAIADMLGALDDKIELNRRMNRTLESLARAVFRQWFVEGEKVNDWENLKWGDIATLEYGKSLVDYQASTAQYVVYGTNGPIGRSSEYLYPSEGIIIGRKGAYRGIHYSPEPFFAIDTAFFLKPTRPLSMKWAYYELLRIDLNSMDSGSAIPSTSRADFYNLPVMLPPNELIDSFEEFVTPLYEKTYANEKESRTLASLRDTLLPKLMRGEVRVKDVEM